MEWHDVKTNDDVLELMETFGYFVESIKSQLSFKPNETIFIGDSDVDILTGKRLGVYTVLKSDTKKGDIDADYVIPNLKQLLRIIEEIDTES